MRKLAHRDVIRHNKTRVKNSPRLPRQARRMQLTSRDYSEPFAPPEDWHEPHEKGGDYKIIVQPPGEDYEHVLTPEQIRHRRAAVPPPIVERPATGCLRLKPRNPSALSHDTQEAELSLLRHAMGSDYLSVSDRSDPGRTFSDTSWTQRRQ